MKMTRFVAIIFFAGIIMFSGCVEDTNVDSLIEDLDNENEIVRVNAMDTLVNMGDEKTIEETEQVILQKDSCSSIDNNLNSSQYNPYILKTYGNVSQNSDKTYISTKKLREIRDNSLEEIERYMYPFGPIVEFGSNPINGHFPIKVYGNLETKDRYYSDYDFNNIYLILDKHANSSQINNLPVIITITNNTQWVGFTDWYEEGSSLHVHTIDISSDTLTLQRLEGHSLNDSTNTESAIYDPDVVKGFGTVPEMEHLLLSNYTQKLKAINNSIPNQMEVYNYPVASYAVHASRGYLVAQVTKSFTEKEMDDIYSLIHEVASDEGIENVPVIFVFLT
ncbi:hypothetical protein [Methanococcoides seepicolus]|uniref:Lipoprotein n=1 Tax=Methanococcoides seepicolus TaxID=2828780 RepID=A0A9E4ZJN9_9EURY|nr:hypothetical protein [Methanococcoides seepicolus]MCM1987899.1 hypothetical protein [Methanococcoides seepicolus]